MMPTKKDVAARLKALRGRVPRTSVAKACGISRSAYGMYELGERMPSDSVKVKLAEFFGTTVEKLFFAKN